MTTDPPTGAPLIVDAMNVIGSRPTGWWRDRDAAVRAFAERLRVYAKKQDIDILLVIDGRPLDDLVEGTHDGVEVRYAHRRGPDAADDRIVELVDELADPAAATVVTADRDLRRRVTERGTDTSGPRRLLDALDAMTPETEG